MNTFGLRAGVGVGVIYGEIEVELMPCYEVELEDNEHDVELEAEHEVELEDNEFDVEICTE